jgi:DNA-binding CsgD family transcriptional regulator
MSRLTHPDLAALLAALGKIYEMRDAEAFGAHVLREIPRLVACDGLSYNEVDIRKRRNRFLTDPVLDLPDSQSVFNRHIADHPLIGYYLATRDGEPVKFSDFLSRARLHRLGLYNEFFRKVGVEHQIGFTLPSPPSLIVGIALNRSRCDFSERDRKLLSLLRPHLAHAHANAEAVSRLKRELALVRQGMEALGCGIVWMQPDGRVHLATEAARRWVGEYFGPWRGPRLPDRLRRWVHRQERGRDARPMPREPLVVEREGKRLIVRLVGDSAGGVLLLENRCTSLDSAVLDRLGLTRRQAEIMTWVAQGKTDHEIAMILGLSPRTVAKHLEHTYEKLGVESRTAAAVLLLEEALQRG